MLNKAKTLKGYKLDGLDGEIGTVKEFYFDDQNWTIRYLVADTGSWLMARNVLISPYALLAVDKEEELIGIDLTRKQIEDSPPLNSDKPVSRQFEESYYRYYGWPLYWGGPYMWGSSYFPNTMRSGEQGRGSAQTAIQYDRLGAPPAFEQTADTLIDSAEAESAGNLHLHSTRDVTGHHIQAADGEIGHVADFVIGDDTWAIRYLMVDTVNWWPGKTVLVATRWIERVSWDESKVFINLSREAIKQAPEYSEESLLTRDYESRLHGHYNRQGYWVEESGDHEAVQPQ